MIAFDTNLLFKANHVDAPGHEKAYAFLSAISTRDDVAVSELVLVEF